MTKIALCLTILQLVVGLCVSPMASAADYFPWTSEPLKKCKITLESFSKEATVKDNLDSISETRQMAQTILGSTSSDPVVRGTLFRSFENGIKGVDNLQELQRRVENFADARMTRFIINNVELLTQKIPEYFKTASDGTPLIDPEFKLFLTKIYSRRLVYEVESQFFKAGHSIPLKDPFYGLVRLKDVSMETVDKVILKKLPITNPRIIALAGTPISKILRGHVDVTSDQAPLEKRIKFAIALRKQTPSAEDIELLKKWATSKGRESSRLQANALMTLGLNNEMPFVEQTFTKKLTEETQANCLEVWSQFVTDGSRFAKLMHGDLFQMKRVLENKIAERIGRKN